MMLLPEIPWPTLTGGKRAHDANLDELRGVVSGLSVCAANVDTNDVHEAEFRAMHADLPTTIVYARSLERAESQYEKLTIRIRNLLSSSPPVFQYLRASGASEVVQILLDREGIDAIWADHFNALAMLPLKKSAPVVLSMQNVESDLLRDIINEAPRFSLRRLKRWIDWKKMCCLEGRLIKEVDHVVCLSDEDARQCRQRFGIREVSVMLPLLFEPRASWRPSRKTQLLFVGQSSHAPNSEAIRWICSALAPALAELDPSVIITIVGCAGAGGSSRKVASNLQLYGRLDRVDLQVLLESCTALLSPVVLGSGIKIKILEAASNGVPVIATPESLVGLGILSGCVSIARSSPQSFAAATIDALRDLDGLQEGARLNLEILRKEYACRGRRMLDVLERLPSSSSTGFGVLGAGNRSSGA